VKKGNLIIIPRANLPSIHAFKRQINVDLNRRFDRDYNQYYEDYLARAIKYLVSKSDGLIHLHEGSGFYSPAYIDNLRNPRHYGQSIIIDTRNFENKISLADLAINALRKINQSIKPARYSFQLFNMNTFTRDTLYPEQRKSLTYYTLNQFKIPAIAVEVSKNIRNLPWKVNCHCLLVKELLSQMGVEIKLPANITQLAREWFNDTVKLKVNGQNVEKQSCIILSPYTELDIQLESKGYTYNHIDKALAATLPNIDYLNLLHTKVVCLQPFPYLNVTLDGKKIKRIKIKWKKRWLQNNLKFPILVYSKDKEVNLARPGTQIAAYEGQTLFLHGLWLEHGQEILNVKGFVSNKISNDGQDKSVPIVLAQKGFMPKYIEKNKNGEWSFEIQRETKGTKKYQWKVKVKKTKFSGVILQGPLNTTQRAYLLLPYNSKSSGNSGSEIFRLKKGKYLLSKLKNDEDIICFVGDYPLPVYPGETLSLLHSGQYILHIFEGRSFEKLGDITLEILDTGH
jgi:hypothetical protein